MNDSEKIRVNGTIVITDPCYIESDSVNPSVVIDVANAVAKIKSIAADKMSDIIYNNTITVLTDGQITQNAIITGG